MEFTTTHTSTTSRFKKAISLFIVAVFVVLQAFLSPAFASPYDAYNSKPGDVITNTVTLNYTVNGIPGRPMSAQSQFTVEYFPPNGEIRAFEQYRGYGDSESWKLYGGEYSTTGNLNGTFRSLGQPKDTSQLTQGNAISVPSIVKMRETTIIRQGVPAVFLLSDDTLNVSSKTIEVIKLVITDSLTGDKETVTFTETAPDSGQFSGWINTAAGTQKNGDGVMQTALGSVLNATYTDPYNIDFQLGVNVAVIPPAPQGTVFNSETGDVVNGLEITLIDTKTGKPAKVLTADLQGTAPATVKTGQSFKDSLGRTISVPNGGFLFPYLEEGTYRIQISDDQEFVGPTQYTLTDLQTIQGSPWALEQASWLKPFTVEIGTDISFDIPVDQVLKNPVVVRNASIDTGSIGDVFEYEVTVTVPLTGTITFVDDLPNSIRAIPGTFTIDGVSYTPTFSEDGRQITFTNIPSKEGVPMVIRYGARIGSTDNTQSWTRLTTARIEFAQDDNTLTLEDKFGLQDTVILGEILAGACGTPIENRDLSGVRVYLETGEYSITDEKGMFTFRDIDRRPHVVQVDERTLPFGAKLVLCQSNTRSAGSAISRFVDVAPGMMGRVDFRVVFDDTAIAAADEKGALATYVLLTPSAFTTYTNEWLDNSVITGPQILAPSAAYKPTSEAIEIVFIRHKNEIPSLLVNGEEVRVSNEQEPYAKAGTPWMLERWQGIRIPQGKSSLQLVMKDAFGKTLRTENTNFQYSNTPGRLILDAAGSSLESTGVNRPIVRLQITDRDGIPVRAGTLTQIKIEQPYAFLNLPDRISAPGSQRRESNTLDLTIGENGMINFELAPVSQSGTAKISMLTRQGKISVDVPIETESQPWILVGIAEGTLANDTVRQNIRPLTSDENSFAGRIAFFAEGVIKGEWLLTMRYDSDTPKDSFYAIDPDKDYIVYGDRSVQGNDAQSRFPLYLRLRKDEAEFLIGDYNLDINTLLINEGRKVSGLRALYETETFKAMMFLSETEQSHARDRLALNGTVGPYTLTRNDIVPNSETVSLLTVSRFDPTLELDSQILSPGEDYVIDYQSGRIYLRNPESAFTDTFDRKVLLVDYETDSGDLKMRLAGIRVEGNITKRIVGGATLLRAEGVDGENINVTIAGFDIEYQINDNSKITAEAVIAQKTFFDGTYESEAQEIRYDYTSETTQAYARLRRQRGDIELTSDRTEEEILTAQVGFAKRLSGPDENTDIGTFIEGTGTYQKNVTENTQTSAVALLKTQRTEQGSQGAGIEISSETNENGETREQVSALAVGTSVSEDKKFRQDASIRGAIYSSDEETTDTLSFGAEYDVLEQTSLFGRLDLTSDRGNGIEDRAFTFGLKSTPWNGFDGIFSVTQTSGLDQSNGYGVFASGTQSWKLSETKTLTFGIDSQKNFGDTNVSAFEDIGNPFVVEDFTAARIGYERIEETWAMGGDIEYRTSDENDTFNARAFADGEINDTWSVGGEIFTGMQKQNDGETIREVNLRFAAAQRRLGKEPITLFQAEIDHSLENTTKTDIYVSATHNRFIGDDDQGELGLRYAVRRTETEITAGSFTGLTQYAGIEYRHDLNETFDIGAQGSVMYDFGTGLSTNSYGLSLGVTPFDNGWVSVGYNFEGFEDEKFSAGGRTEEGAFVQFRLKFDQNTIQNMFR
jgi:hypothetical protein